MMSSRHALAYAAFLVLAAASMLLPHAPAQAQTDVAGKGGAVESPLHVVQNTSEAVLAILRDPELMSEDKVAESQQGVAALVHDVFDWQAMARSGLGRHWRSRTQAERDEFVGLFRELLQQVYFRRLEQHAAKATVVYKGEEVEKSEAVVKTIAEHAGKEIPIDYHLHFVPKKAEDAEGTEATGGENEEDGHEWLVYDVRIEGVSLLLNYREQFNEVIVGGSYEILVKKLKKKLGKE